MNALCEDRQAEELLTLLCYRHEYVQFKCKITYLDWLTTEADFGRNINENQFYL
jgi:hypothetical protein